MTTDRAIYVLTEECYSDYRLAGIVAGPPDADMKALREEHRQAAAEVTPRMLGMRAYRITQPHGGNTWIVCSPPRDAPIPLQRSGISTEEVDDPALDVPYVDDYYGWRALFGEWLVHFRGFTKMAYTEFNYTED